MSENRTEPYGSDPAAAADAAPAEQSGYGMAPASPYGSAPAPTAGQTIHVTNNIVVNNVKSTLVSYVLWFFLGMLGVHKFYLRQTGMGVTYLLLGLVGWATAAIAIGFVFLGVLWILLIIDLFTMPGRVAKLNQAAQPQQYTTQQ